MLIIQVAFLRICTQRACESMKTLRRIFGAQRVRDVFGADGYERDAAGAVPYCDGVCGHDLLSHGRKAMRVRVEGFAVCCVVNRPERFFAALRMTPDNL